MKLKRWKVDTGNSSTGPVGFVVYDLIAPDKRAALAILRDSYALPEDTETHGEDFDGRRTLVRIYFNANAIRLKDVYLDDDQTDIEDA